MTIPDYQTIMLPLLRFLRDDEVHSKREAVRIQGTRQFIVFDGQILGKSRSLNWPPLLSFKHGK